MSFYLVTFGSGRWDYKTFAKKAAAVRWARKNGGRVTYGKQSAGFVTV